MGYPGIPVPICVGKNIVLTPKLKISEPVFRKWEIKTYLLVFHPVIYGGASVYLDLWNYQKLMSETFKSDPDG